MEGGWVTGANSCTACAAGKYSIKSDVQFGCTDCVPGKYKSELSQATDTCIACPAGSKTNTGTGTGAILCTACAAGKYSTKSDVQSCTDCVAGNYVAARGTTCEQCQAGQYDDDQNAATACTSVTTCTSSQHITSPATLTNDNVCTQNRCTCSNGTPETGSGCTTNNKEICAITKRNLALS